MRTTIEKIDFDAQQPFDTYRDMDIYPTVVWRGYMAAAIEKIYSSIAAGFLFTDLSHQSVLLFQRSRLVMNSGVWSVPGGRRYSNQGCLITALRETKEEAGFLPNGKIIMEPYVWHKPDGRSQFQYHTFIFEVTDPSGYHPRLNWEHADAQWCNLSSLPNRTHVGVQEVLKNSGHFSI